MFLSLSFSLPFPLSKNKYITSKSVYIDIEAEIEMYVEKCLQPILSGPPRASLLLVYPELSPPMSVELDPSSRSATLVSLGKSYNLTKPVQWDTSQNVWGNE